MKPKTIVPLAHLHLVTPDEAQLLGSLLGKTLHSLAFDSMFVLCALDSLYVMCSPEPGIGRSPADPYEELMRTKYSLAPVDDVSRFMSAKFLKHHHFDQKVIDIRILTTLVLFTPPIDSPPVDVLGVTIPAGRDYSVIRLKPFTKQAKPVVRALTEHNLVNQVDIGIQIRLENRTNIALATNGSSYFVNVYAEPDELKNLKETSLFVELKERLSSESNSE